MLELHAKAKNYLKAMDRLVMSCDDEDEVRMLACVMMTSAITILEQQVGARGTQKLLNNTMEARHGRGLEK